MQAKTLKKYPYEYLRTAMSQIRMRIRAVWTVFIHYENMPIQIYWKSYLQKLKIFR